MRHLRGQGRIKERTKRSCDTPTYINFSDPCLSLAVKHWTTEAYLSKLNALRRLEGKRFFCELVPTHTRDKKPQRHWHKETNIDVSDVFSYINVSLSMVIFLGLYHKPTCTAGLLGHCIAVQARLNINKEMYGSESPQADEWNNLCWCKVCPGIFLTQ